MRILIKNGTIIDPQNQVHARLNLLMEDEKIVAITHDEPVAGQVFDVAGKVVAPGFVDIHMHEDPIGADGTLYKDEDKAIFCCMLRMGVTTVVGGQCGISQCNPGDYLDIIDRGRAAVNVAMLAGHSFLRDQAGQTDKYAPVTENQLESMEYSFAEALDRGCLGVSFGIRYVPGIDRRELERTATICKRPDKLIAAHVRSDAAEVFNAAREFMNVGVELGLSVQVSHIGSMAGFGQMEEFLRLIDTYKMNGLRVACDCYPYAAFSTELGSTTYDEGWRGRYNCGYDVVELCEGKYKGMRCTREIFKETRRDCPKCMTVCYVMKEADVERAFAHPNVMLASDGILNKGHGHPRAAGAFPRLLAAYVRTGKLSLYEAIRMMTAMPAEKMRLRNKGRLNVGADADVVVFDPGHIQDCAVFAEPVKPGVGIDYVFIGGKLAARGCKIIENGLGRALRG